MLNIALAAARFGSWARGGRQVPLEARFDSWSQGGLRATDPQTRRPYVGLGLNKLDPIRRPRPKEEMG